MKILDATTGFKGIWYQKNHPFVTFMDKRKEKINCKSAEMKFKNSRTVNINPDIVSTWEDCPFPNDYFDMIIFDPPHILKSKHSKLSQLQKQYGYLDKDTWKQDIKQGINKLFNVLKPNGFFILKWCENSIKVEEIIKMMPYKPLFGSNTKQKGHTANFWILFLKYRLEQELDIK